jgi:general stress protein YciG
MPNNNNNRKKGTMTVQEAGRKGGQATKRTHGSEFYSRIGKKGGQRSRRGAAKKTQQTR